MTKVRGTILADRESLIDRIAAFRVELSTLRGRERDADPAAAGEELDEYIEREYPVFVAEDDAGRITGYLVCRVDGSAVWAESMYVAPESRRQGVAGRLYDAAEALARERGEPTLYNWIHPNNGPIIAFLASRGYDVLNLIEVRRAYPGEAPSTTLPVGDHEYRY